MSHFGFEIHVVRGAYSLYNRPRGVFATVVGVAKSVRLRVCVRAFSCARRVRARVDKYKPISCDVCCLFIRKLSHEHKLIITCLE